MRLFGACLAALLVLAVGRRVSAHAMRSVYIEIVEEAPGRGRVSFRSALPVSGVRIRVDPPCALTRLESEAGGGTEPRAMVLTCEPRFSGNTIRVEGLGPIASDAVVWASLVDVPPTSHLLTASSPAWTLPGGESSFLKVATSYVLLGLRHIAEGADHLLFLLGLVLSLRRLRTILAAETAFTLSHSLTYSATALGWIRVSSQAAEAAIALSLVLVALDAASDTRLPARRAAGLAFAFGLVHGLGFAGGLRETGLPEAEIPVALVGFAVGVEIGQIVFLVAVTALLAVLARWVRATWVRTIPAYVVGSVGAYWLIDRVFRLWG